MKKHTIPLFGFLLVFFSACHQEGFILLRNLDKAEWLTITQMLTESGLAIRENYQTNTVVSRPPTQPPTTPTIPHESRYMTIPANKDFIIQLPGDQTLVSLKSVTGLTYLKEASNPDQKVFSFRAGTNNGRAIFQYYDLDGNLQKNLTYYFQVQNTPETNTTFVTTRKPQSTPQEETPSTNTTPTRRLTNQTITWFLSSLQTLPPNEAIKNLENATTDSSFSDSEKEQITYTLIEYYLKQRLFTRASNRIATLQDEGYQAYYTGLYHESLQRFPTALAHLSQALDIGGPVLPQAIIAAERVMLAGGILDASLTTRLDTLSASMQNPAQKAQSLVQLAQLYEGLRNLKRARELYQTVIQGDFPTSWKKRAQQNLTLLEEQFR